MGWNELRLKKPWELYKLKGSTDDQTDSDIAASNDRGDRGLGGGGTTSGTTSGSDRAPDDPSRYGGGGDTGTWSAERWAAELAAADPSGGGYDSRFSDGGTGYTAPTAPTASEWLAKTIRDNGGGAYEGAGDIGRYRTIGERDAAGNLTGRYDYNPAFGVGGEAGRIIAERQVNTAMGAYGIKSLTNPNPYARGTPESFGFAVGDMREQLRQANEGAGLDYGKQQSAINQATGMRGKAQRFSEFGVARLSNGVYVDSITGSPIGVGETYLNTPGGRYTIDKAQTPREQIKQNIELFGTGIPKENQLTLNSMQASVFGKNKDYIDKANTFDILTSVPTFERGTKSSTGMVFTGTGWANPESAAFSKEASFSKPSNIMNLSESMFTKSAYDAFGSSGNTTIQRGAAFDIATEAQHTGGKIPEDLGKVAASQGFVPGAGGWAALVTDSQGKLITGISTVPVRNQGMDYGQMETPTSGELAGRTVFTQTKQQVLDQATEGGTFIQRGGYGQFDGNTQLRTDMSGLDMYVNTASGFTTFLNPKTGAIEGGGGIYSAQGGAFSRTLDGFVAKSRDGSILWNQQPNMPNQYDKAGNILSIGSGKGNKQDWIDMINNPQLYGSGEAYYFQGGIKQDSLNPKDITYRQHSFGLPMLSVNPITYNEKGEADSTRHDADYKALIDQSIYAQSTVGSENFVMDVGKYGDQRYIMGAPKDSGNLVNFMNRGSENFVKGQNSGASVQNKELFNYGYNLEHNTAPEVYNPIPATKMVRSSPVERVTNPYWGTTTDMTIIGGIKEVPDPDKPGQTKLIREDDTFIAGGSNYYPAISGDSRFSKAYGSYVPQQTDAQRKESERLDSMYNANVAEITLDAINGYNSYTETWYDVQGWKEVANPLGGTMPVNVAGVSDTTPNTPDPGWMSRGATKGSSGFKELDISALVASAPSTSPSPKDQQQLGNPFAGAGITFVMPTEAVSERGLLNPVQGVQVTSSPQLDILSSSKVSDFMGQSTTSKVFGGSPLMDTVSSSGLSAGKSIYRESFVATDEQPATVSPFQLGGTPSMKGATVEPSPMKGLTFSILDGGKALTSPPSEFKDMYPTEVSQSPNWIDDVPIVGQGVGAVGSVLTGFGILGNNNPIVDWQVENYPTSKMQGTWLEGAANAGSKRIITEYTVGEPRVDHSIIVMGKLGADGIPVDYTIHTNTISPVTSKTTMGESGYSAGQRGMGDAYVGSILPSEAPKGFFQTMNMFTPLGITDKNPIGGASSVMESMYNKARNKPLDTVGDIGAGYITGVAFDYLGAGYQAVRGVASTAKAGTTTAKAARLTDYVYEKLPWAFGGMMAAGGAAESTQMGTDFDQVRVKERASDYTVNTAAFLYGMGKGAGTVNAIHGTPTRIAETTTTTKTTTKQNPEYRDMAEAYPVDAIGDVYAGGMTIKSVPRYDSKTVSYSDPTTGKTYTYEAEVGAPTSKAAEMGYTNYLEFGKLGTKTVPKEITTTEVTENTIYRDARVGGIFGEGGSYARNAPIIKDAIVNIAEYNPGNYKTTITPNERSGVFKNDAYTPSGEWKGQVGHNANDGKGWVDGSSGQTPIGEWKGYSYERTGMFKDNGLIDKLNRDVSYDKKVDLYQYPAMKYEPLDFKGGAIVSGGYSPTRDNVVHPDVYGKYSELYPRPRSTKANVGSIASVGLPFKLDIPVAAKKVDPLTLGDNLPMRNLMRFTKEPVEFSVTSDANTGKILAANRGRIGYITPEAYTKSISEARASGATDVIQMHTHPKSEKFMGEVVLDRPSDIDVSSQSLWRDYAKTEHGIDIVSSGVISEKGVSLYSIPSEATGKKYSGLIDKNMNIPDNLIGTGGEPYYKYEQRARVKALDQLSLEPGVTTKFIPWLETPVSSPHRTISKAGATSALLFGTSVRSPTANSRFGISSPMDSMFASGSDAISKPIPRPIERPRPEVDRVLDYNPQSSTIFRSWKTRTLEPVTTSRTTVASKTIDARIGSSPVYRAYAPVQEMEMFNTVSENAYISKIAARSDVVARSQSTNADLTNTYSNARGRSDALSRFTDKPSVLAMTGNPALASVLSVPTGRSTARSLDTILPNVRTIATPTVIPTTRSTAIDTPMTSSITKPIPIKIIPPLGFNFQPGSSQPSGGGGRGRGAHREVIGIGSSLESFFGKRPSQPSRRRRR